MYVFLNRYDAVASAAMTVTNYKGLSQTLACPRN